MIPSAINLWAPMDQLPLRSLHPACRLGLGVLAVLTALLAPAPVLVPLAIVLGCLDDRVSHRMQGGTVGPQLETKQAGAQSQRQKPDDGQPEPRVSQ